MRIASIVCAVLAFLVVVYGGYMLYAYNSSMRETEATVESMNTSQPVE